MNVALDAARDDFLFAMVPFGVLQQRRNQQRHCHHGSEHDHSSGDDLTVVTIRRARPDVIRRYAEAIFYGVDVFRCCLETCLK